MIINRSDKSIEKKKMNFKELFKPVQFVKRYGKYIYQNSHSSCFRR
jgi:hypothetical protein